MPLDQTPALSHWRWRTRLLSSESLQTREGDGPDLSIYFYLINICWHLSLSLTTANISKEKTNINDSRSKKQTTAGRKGREINVWKSGPSECTSVSFLISWLSPEGGLATWRQNYVVGAERKLPRETLVFWPENQEKGPQWVEEYRGWSVFFFLNVLFSLGPPWSRLALQRNAIVEVAGHLKPQEKTLSVLRGTGERGPRGWDNVGGAQAEASRRRSAPKFACESAHIPRSPRAGNA